MTSLLAADASVVAVLGAHCDDIAIGLGGTLLSLSTGAAGNLAVHALVLSGQGTPREEEERKALAALCPGAAMDVTILDLPDGGAPGAWVQVKEAVESFRGTCEPDLVFAPQRMDAHQDHRLLAQLVPTAFRNHLILGYEILKWESDLPHPTVYHPVPPSTARTKAQLLHDHYPSQHERDWFDEEAFLGLTRVRGVQCRHHYAEGFTVEKATLRFLTDGR